MKYDIRLQYIDIHFLTKKKRDKKELKINYHYSRPSFIAQCGNFCMKAVRLKIFRNISNISRLLDPQVGQEKDQTAKKDSHAIYSLSRAQKENLR